MTDIDPAFATAALRHHRNAAAATGAYPDDLAAILGPGDAAAAWEEIGAWPGYAETPLRPLDGLAAALGLSGIHYKDEGGRFGLGSFKALGGAYAVLRLLLREISKRRGQATGAAEVRVGAHRGLARDITVVTATDGNHGRSVAWGARQFGTRCVIYIHAKVSEGRKAAMEALGAEVIRIDGDYDESVRRAAADADGKGWFVVSDTSYDGYLELPRIVMAGYTVMAAEARRQMPPTGAPSHVFLQGGVGGLAAAVVSDFWAALGEGRPRVVIVEPERAACLYRSAVDGRPTAVTITDETVMAGLSCGEVSELAWRILERGADDFLTIPDELVAPAMRGLAADYGGAPIVAGESAVAGVAAVIAARRHDGLSAALGLTPDSRVLLFGTEGATDPEIYRAIVGRDAADVASA